MNKHIKRFLYLIVIYLVIAFSPVWGNYQRYKTRCLMPDETAIKKSIDIATSLGARGPEVALITKTFSEKEARKRLYSSIAREPFWILGIAVTNIGFQRTKTLQLKDRNNTIFQFIYICENENIIEYYQFSTNSYINEKQPVKTSRDEIEQTALEFLPLFITDDLGDIGIANVSSSTSDDESEIVFSYKGIKKLREPDSALTMRISSNGRLESYENHNAFYLK